MRADSVRQRTDEASGCDYLPAIPQLKAIAINIIIWILVGGLLGLSACKCVGIRNWKGIILNIAVGIGGVMLCGWLIGGFIGSSEFHMGTFSVAGLLVSLLGTSVLLAAVQLLGGVKGRRSPLRGGDQHASGTRRRVRVRKEPMAVMRRSPPLERIR